MKKYGANTNCCTVCYQYDKLNKQEDFKVYAQDFNGKWHCGWIVIEQPWYSNQSEWTYYLYVNKYGPGGICGGAVDLGLVSIIVRGDTIIPATQVNTIKIDLINGCKVFLKYHSGEQIALICPDADDSWIEELYTTK